MFKNDLLKIKNKIFLDYGLVFAIIALCSILSILKPNSFLTFRNINNIFEQMSYLGIISLGLTFAVAVGSIDISIGYLTTLGGISIGASFQFLGLDHMPAFLLSIFVVTLAGLLNGFLLTKLPGINPLILTAATGFVFSGFNWIISQGSQLWYGMPNSFYFWGRARLGIIPLPVIIMMFLYFICWFILEKTMLGRYIYAVGSNEITAKLSGININKYKILAHVICGIFAGFSGILLTSKMQVAMPNIGAGFLIQSIAAVFLGTSIFKKGKANVWGTFLGVFIMGLAFNSVAILGIPYHFEQIIRGLVIIVALIISTKHQYEYE